MLVVATVKGWMVPWQLFKNSGRYFIYSNYKFESSSHGTAMIKVDGNNAYIHPNELNYIQGINDITGMTEINLILDASMPSRDKLAQSQLLDTIEFVDRYNHKLADYLIITNIDRLQP